MIWLPSCCRLSVLSCNKFAVFGYRFNISRFVVSVASVVFAYAVYSIPYGTDTVCRVVAVLLKSCFLCNRGLPPPD